MTITVLHLRNPKTGAPYRKTLQYGYDRQQGIDRHMGQKLNGLNTWKYTPEQSAEIQADLYVCGFLPPNYPVPVVELDSALAGSPERVPFSIKKMLLDRC